MEGEYEIIYYVDLESINQANDNIDVHVRFSNGHQYTATFYTVDNIRFLMEEFQKDNQGECANGMYFWSPDMVVVNYLSEENIKMAVDDMVFTKTLSQIFSGPASR